MYCLVPFRTPHVQCNFAFTEHEGWELIEIVYTLQSPQKMIILHGSPSLDTRWVLRGQDPRILPASRFTVGNCTKEKFELEYNSWILTWWEN